MASRVLTERGYRDASLRAIGREMGMESAHLLYYFRSREALLEAVITSWDETTREIVGDAEFLERWPAVVRRNSQVPGLVHLYTALAAEASGPTHPSHQFFKERYRRIRASIERDLRQGVLSGRYALDLPPERVAVILISLSDGLQLQWLVDSSLDMAAELEAAISRLTHSET